LDFLCELYYDARIHEHQILPKTLTVIEFKSSTPTTKLLPIISYCNRLHQFHDKQIYMTNTETQNLG